LGKLRSEIDSVGVYDLHDILRQQNILEWCEWHLTFDKDDKAVEVAELFHKELEKSKLSSSITGKIDTIVETFLDYMLNDNDWNEIRKCFEEARQNDSPLPIIKAYTKAQNFSCRINKHASINTYHALKLYCTLLNCPILAQTQEYTEAITSLLFHPKLDECVVRNAIVYRGAVLDDMKLVADYNEGATIITTTFLSTSRDRGVAKFYGTPPPGNKIGIICIYNINNTDRRTALELGKLTYFDGEREILILRYIPFTTKSVERTNDGRQITISFDECKEK
jgi:hypothetical protein